MRAIATGQCAWARNGEAMIVPIALSAETVVLFPGQGVSLAGARDPAAERCPQLFERCCEMLGDDPFERAFASTRYAQPAIFLAGIATWLELEADAALDADGPLALAGHSLGELSALAAAGVLGLEDALSLVVLRGALMAEAAERQGDGGMLAILKGTLADALELAGTHRVVLANDNAPGQTILSGPSAALDAVAADARERGLRAMRLDVAGAFHAPAMASACQPLLEALAGVALSPPRTPVYSGMTAAPFRDLRAELAQALVRPVRWRETMLALRAAGARCFLDVGPDRVLARLVARNLGGVEALALVDRSEEVADGVRA
jgi:[acyl-carrier-protein] S-malonyltransferase